MKRSFANVRIRTIGLGLTLLTAATSVCAQTPSVGLGDVLRDNLCQRIQMPLIFATRDTTFALSLPTDEPATIYLQLTVGRNGKVKEKQTKVYANHLAQYVTPAFVEASKGLRIDRALVDNKDTSLLVAFPLEYQCARDTIINEWEGMIPQQGGPMFYQRYRYASSIFGSNGEVAVQERIKKGGNPSGQWDGKIAQAVLVKAKYYKAFLKD